MKGARWLRAWGFLACIAAIPASMSAQKTTLKMRSEHLTSLPRAAIDSNLTCIDLRRNALEVWPSELGVLPGLERLRLARNPIEWPDTLSGFTALRYLDLWNTDISRVPVTVKGFESLEEMDLRATYLDESHRAALEQLFPGVEIHLTQRCTCNPKP